MFEDPTGPSRQARAWASRWLWLVAAGAALIGLGAAIWVGEQGQWPLWSGLSIGIGVALVVGGAAKTWNRLRLAAAASEGGRRDRLQRQRRRQLIILPVLMLAFIGQSLGGLEAIMSGHGRSLAYLQVLIPVLYGWVIPVIVMGWDFHSRQHRRFLDDEFTRMLRVRAIIPAFVSLMIGTTAAFAVGLWRPSVGVAVAAMAIAVSGAVGGLRFAWLDREAEGG